MYWCGHCEMLSEPREKMVKVVMQTRKRPEGGHEIVREMGVHPNCAASMAAGEVLSESDTREIAKRMALLGHDGRLLGDRFDG